VTRTTFRVVVVGGVGPFAIEAGPFHEKLRDVLAGNVNVRIPYRDANGDTRAALLIDGTLEVHDEPGMQKLTGEVEIDDDAGDAPEHSRFALDEAEVERRLGE
jgi:2-methylaconitate cis-trans-isomerase PrpF